MADEMKPSKVDLAKPEAYRDLPRWAVVAFAARCARRVLPLFDAFEPLLKRGYRNSVAYATRVAAYAAARADADAATADATDADDAADAADRDAAVATARAAAAAVATAGAADADARATDAATAAAAATGAYAVAGHAAATADDDVAYAEGDDVAYAEGIARAAAAADDAPAAARDATMADYQLLAEAARVEGWTDHTPVPQGFFGPLWPGGVPEGWPEQEETSEGHELVLTIEIPDDATDEQIKAMVADFAERADDLHRAYGGNGLTIEDIEIHGDVHVGEEVLS